MGGWHCHRRRHWLVGCTAVPPFVRSCVCLSRQRVTIDDEESDRRPTLKVSKSVSTLKVSLTPHRVFLRQQLELIDECKSTTNTTQATQNQLACTSAATAAAQRLGEGVWRQASRWVIGFYVPVLDQSLSVSSNMSEVGSFSAAPFHDSTTDDSMPIPMACRHKLGLHLRIQQQLAYCNCWRRHYSV